MDMAEGLREHRRMAGVAASELGAKEEHRVPRVWPWCEETKSMARERRATRGCLTERVSGLGSQDSRGRGRKGSAVPVRGACTHRASRQAARRGKRFTIPLHKVSRRVADTSNAVPVVTLRVAAWKIATARSTSGHIL